MVRRRRTSRSRSPRLQRERERTTSQPGEWANEDQFLGYLLSAGVPLVMVQLVAHIASAGMLNTALFNFVEFFCGTAAILRSMQRAGFNGIGYDIERGHFGNVNLMDINSDWGFAFAVLLCILVEPGGLVWLLVHHMPCRIPP